ncbi:hypothetical protein [Cesiribacter andamanensis]|uniref:Uncharacterized protein n=1 Tax=Cesiribacter andamanensis AMV16 TaxID=1279009 RepID=M7N6B3_9BACT|nr:hypothetical protein [Cesiribacter andamanensis]EMR02812.1 hypothetical protein ADICEAN_02020 [Cesiribacter andamanensis AMV16]
MLFFQQHRLRALQLGVLLASGTSTALQFFVPLQLAVALNVVLLSLIFGAIYTARARSPYTILMLGSLLLVNAISIWGMLRHGLEVYTIALLGAHSALYLLPFFLGVFAPLLLFWGLYEVQALVRTFGSLRS